MKVIIDAKTFRPEGCLSYKRVGLIDGETYIVDKSDVILHSKEG